MKYIVIIILVVVSFFAGMFFENDRMDRVAAVLMSRQAMDNANYQLDLNSKYISLIEKKDYESLKEQIGQNESILSGTIIEAQAICEQFKCSSKMKEYIDNARNK